MGTDARPTRQQNVVDLVSGDEPVEGCGTADGAAVLAEVEVVEERRRTSVDRDLEPIVSSPVQVAPIVVEVEESAPPCLAS